MDGKKLKDMTRKEFREQYGTTEKKIEIPVDAKKELKKEMLELETEKHINEDELTLGHALLLMKKRSASMRGIRQDPDLRTSLSQTSS